MREACDLGEERACLTLSGAYKGGKGLPKDNTKVRLYNKKALDLYAQKCNKDNTDSCAMASNLYYVGYGTQNFFKSNEYSKKACNWGRMESCVKLASSYALGKGARQDYEKANVYYKKACDEGEISGCVSLGSNYMLGNGVKKNKSKAKDIFGKACDAGYQSGCDYYSILNH